MFISCNNHLKERSKRKKKKVPNDEPMSSQCIKRKKGSKKKVPNDEPCHLNALKKDQRGKKGKEVKD